MALQRGWAPSGSSQQRPAALAPSTPALARVRQQPNRPPARRAGLLVRASEEAAASSSSSSPWPQQQQQAQQHQQPHALRPRRHLLGGSAAAAGAASTLQRVLQLVNDGNLDGLLEFCPDEVIDRLLAWREETGCAEGDDVRFEDILLANNDPQLLHLDTFAVRNLIMAAPASVSALSAMQVSRDKYLQRCAIVSASGEECVLTFTVVLQDSLECQYRGPPLVSKKWMLRSVTGECNSDELPSHPSPSFPPEAVVEAQLAALREGRVAPVFAHASPENKKATGPIERFAAMLKHNPLYTPLMGHAAAETVQRLQPSEHTYMEVVKITPSSGSSSGGGSGGRGATAAKQRQRPPAAAGGLPPLLYMWVVSRQPGSSTWSSCWMTDAVQMVAAAPERHAPPPSSSRPGGSQAA